VSLQSTSQVPVVSPYNAKMLLFQLKMCVKQLTKVKKDNFNSFNKGLSIPFLYYIYFHKLCNSTNEFAEGVGLK
jgi:hypothetical protein